jgi:hypothetical protein
MSASEQSRIAFVSHHRRLIDRSARSVAGLECGDQREALLFDDGGGAVVGELGFGGGELACQLLVVEDGVDPAGEVVAGAVVAQHTAVTEDELGFELGEVGGDRSGRGVALVAEI